MRLILLSIICLSFSIGISAQRSCGTDHLHHQRLENDSEYKKKYAFNEIRRKNAQKQNYRSLASQVIPVAVHFDSPINCDDWECLIEIVEAQIEVINEDFSASNDDLEDYDDLNSACPAAYPLSIAPDENVGSDLEFCLASKNHPAGSGLSDGEPAITVGEYFWNGGNGEPLWEGYLNIFVYDLPGGLLGQASCIGCNADGDGVRVTLQAFGAPGVSCSSGATFNTSNNYGLGRTLTHEIGHYLNLLHVFSGCGGGDGIGDTWPQNAQTFGDPAPGINDCGDVLTSCGDEPRNFYSFMDYTDDVGMIMFTADQSDVMNDYAASIDWANDATVCDDDYGAPECADISVPLAMELVDFEDLPCNGEANGYIEVEAIGGDGDYTYTIMPGGDSNNTGLFEDLPGGDYTIEVEDGDGQTFEIEVTLEEPDPLLVDLIFSMDLTCFDGEDGIIEIEISGGTEDYEVSLNGDGMGDDEEFEELEADTYLIEVEDDNGCETSIEVTLNQPDQLFLDLENIEDPTCAGYDDGILDVIASGGTTANGNYNYSIDGIDFQTTGIFNVPSGDYEIIVEDDNGCQTTIEAEIFEPDQIIVEVTDSQESISCFGDTDAFVEIEGSNTDGPYTYSADGIDYSNSGLFENLGAGTITLYTQDDNNCVETIDFTVISPDLLEIEAIIGSEISCFGENDGIVNLNSLGGTSGYNYFLEDMNTPVTAEVEDLGPGTYDFIVEDANGCTAMTSISIEEPEEISIDLISIQEVECFGDDDGEAQITGSGGVGDFIYILDGDENNDGIFTGLTSGTYVATVEDANGCTDEIIFDITQTSSLEIDVAVNSSNDCAGETNGSFTLSGDGGTGNYQYSIDGVNFTNQDTYDNLPGGIYNVFVIDENDCITASSATIEEPMPISLEAMEINSINCNGNQTGVISIAASGGADGFSYTLGMESNMTGIFMDLAAGSMSIEVTDQNGCTSSVEITLDEPDAILSSTDVTNNSCEGMMEGSVQATASGGEGELTYQLGSDSNMTGLFENLEAGMYDVIITDGNNCSVTETVFINNDINLQLSLVNSASPTCNDTEDGVIEVAADGGNGSYTYTLGMESNDTGVFQNVAAGDYIVLVNDPFGCQTELEVSIAATPLIDISQASVEDALCNGENSGSVNLNADGGSGTLNFTLNGETNTTGIFEELPAGEYDLLVMDDNGCETNSVINIDEPDVLNITDILSQDIVCFGDNTGAVSFAGAGGTGNLSFELDGQQNPTGEFGDLEAGTYELSVIDENNCSVSEMIVIDQAPQIVADMQQIQDVECFGLENGAISIEATGGTGNLSYTLAGQQSTEGAFINLGAGAYTVVITDDLGCMTEVTVDIQEPADLNISPLVSDVMGDDLGAISLTVGGGDGNYTAVLNGTTVADQDLQFTGLEPGIYMIDVTDGKGCNKTIEVEVRLVDVYDGLPYGITINEMICPNPGTDIITLKYESTIDQEIIFTIYNDLGQFIGRFTDDVLAGPNTQVFDIRDFSQGAYFLRVVAERQDEYFQFIKMD